MRNKVSVLFVCPHGRQLILPVRDIGACSCDVDVSVYACVSLLLWVSAAALFHIYTRPSTESILCERCTCLRGKRQIVMMGVWWLFPWSHLGWVTFTECVNDMRANCAWSYRVVLASTGSFVHWNAVCEIIVQWFSMTKCRIKLEESLTVNTLVLRWQVGTLATWFTGTCHTMSCAHVVNIQSSFTSAIVLSNNG